MKPNVVFFSREYQATLFPLLKSSQYNSIHITLTKREKREIVNGGGKVEYCFEEFNNTDPLLVQSHYLESSFFSDRFLNRFKVDDREIFLRKEIAFWAEIFDKYKPVAVINEQVAIEIAEVMYIEAKKRGIAYKAWMNNPVNGYFYWLSNPMSLTLNNEVFDQTPSNKSIELAKQYLHKVKVENERPYYLNPYLNISYLKNILGSFNSYLKNRTKELLKKKGIGQYENSSPASKEALKRSLAVLFYKYDNFEKLKNREIILFPLHYEPEASLLYLSEFFSNQIALIENISKCLGQNQVLVVKEHPAQGGMLLTKKYRQLHQSVSNLYYLPHTIISYDVIKVSTLIVTLTSHLGWEALILGKPVFLLGKMFYGSYPFINKFESFEVLRKKILENDFIYPQEEAILIFTAQLLDQSYKGKPFPSDGLYSEENINDLTKSLEAEIKKLI